MTEEQKQQEQQEIPKITIDGVEYDYAKMEDQQKLIVRHVVDIDNKIQKSMEDRQKLEFELMQLRFGRQAFISALDLNLKQNTEEIPEEKGKEEANKKD